MKHYKGSFIKHDKTIITDNVSSPSSPVEIYALLFISHIHPSYNDIISSLTTFYNHHRSLSKNFEIINIYLEDTETAYNAHFTSQLQIPWLALPYVNTTDIIEDLLNDYNVNSIPLLIVFDKEGRKITSLNKVEIININETTFNGWVNESYEKKQQLRIGKFIIGDKGYSSCHAHNLLYTDYTLKSSGYKVGNWSCDVCGKSFAKTVTCFYCGLCGFDICDACYIKYK